MGHSAEFNKFMEEQLISMVEGLKRAEELRIADKEGRLIVLPVKVGDTVYEICDRCDFPGDCGTKMKCRGCEYRDISIEPCLFSLQMLDDFGKTVFTSSEAAEAALKEAQQG